MKTFKYLCNTLVEGKIIAVEAFGFFVNIKDEDYHVGLIHRDEVFRENLVFAVGQSVLCKTLHDSDEREIKLRFVKFL